MINIGWNYRLEFIKSRYTSSIIRYTNCSNRLDCMFNSGFGLTLLINGLIQPGLSSDHIKSERSQHRFIWAVTALDLRSVPLLLLVFSFVSKIRNDSDSLPPAALANFGINLGWLIYPFIYQFTADLLWGQLPGSTGKLYPQTYP